MNQCQTVGVTLLVWLTGTVGAAAARPGVILGATMASELEWMKGMPSPPGSREYLAELRRRIAAGSPVRLRTVYHSFRQFGSSRFGLDHEGERTWSATMCRVVAPERFAGLVIPINHTVDVPSGSCWKTEGCVAEFDINERIVEAMQDDVFGFTESIFDSELTNLKLEVSGVGASSAKRVVGKRKSLSNARDGTSQNGRRK